MSNKMQGFRVYFKVGSDNIELNIPDIYRDSDSETTTDQLRTHLATNLEIDYYNLEVDVKRDTKIRRKCKDYTLEDEDEVFFYETVSQVIDVNKLKMKIGFSSAIQSLNAPNEYSEKILESITNREEEHRVKAEEVIRIFRAFLDKINDHDDRSFIGLLAIMNYTVLHTNCYPFMQLKNRYYFCYFDNEGQAKGLGYMFDFDTLTYYQGQFNDMSIYHGRSVCMSDDGFYTACKLYVDGMSANEGIKKYFFRNEVYSGCFVDNLYGNSGSLTNNDGVYNGKFKSGKRSMLGTMKYSNGDVYIGYWSNGKRSFHGKMNYANGDHYIGSWSEDKKDDFGLYYDKCMNITYVGTFKDDKRSFNDDEYYLHKGNHQFSTITGAYEVELAIDNNNNKTTIIAKTCYDGNLLLNCSSKNIPCDEFTQRQCFYTGNFDIMRQFYGYGRLFINPNFDIIKNKTVKDQYSPGYIQDRFNGYIIFTGMFDDNKLNGFGMITYTNGDRYFGTVKDNTRNGHGTMIKNDGTRYSGFWNSGRIIHKDVTKI